MRILFVCNKSPYPQKEGGPMAMNMLIEGLLAAGHEVKVLAVNSFKYPVSEQEVPREYRQKTGIELVSLDLRVKVLPALVNLFSGKSYHMERFISAKFREKLISILRSREFDVVQLETLFMCPYIGTIRKHSAAKIILRAHNIEHLIWERAANEARNPVKQWYLRHLAMTLRDYERSVAGSVDGIAAITATDAEYFMNILPAGGTGEYSIPVTDIPFGVDPSGYTVGGAGGEYPTLFTIGAMNWIPNAEGVKWFIDQVWPDVHRRFPELTYYLAGRAMPGWMLDLQVPGIHVLGEVEDAREFIASNTIMIVPLFSGSGIRIKIIEGMAAGKTVISTLLGAEGIHYTNGENILIADAPCEFFDMISLCIEDPPRRTRIGKGARLLAETVYDRKSIVARLVSFYEQIL